MLSTNFWYLCTPASAFSCKGSPFFTALFNFSCAFSNLSRLLTGILASLPYVTIPSFTDALACLSVAPVLPRGFLSKAAPRWLGLRICSACFLITSAVTLDPLTIEVLRRLILVSSLSIFLPICLGILLIFLPKELNTGKIFPTRLLAIKAINNPKTPFDSENHLSIGLRPSIKKVPNLLVKSSTADAKAWK